MRRERHVQDWITSLGTAIPLMITAVVSLTIPVTVAARIGLSPAHLSSWILVAFGATVSGIYLSWRYQQPLLLITNAFVIVFYASVAEDYAYAEFIGATIIAGMVIVLGSMLGILDLIARAVPMPVVFGLLAGIVLPYAVDIFSALNDEPFMIGATLLAYFVSFRLFGNRIPPVLPALLIGTLVALSAGRMGAPPDSIPLPSVVLTAPVFSAESIIAVTPVLVMVLTVQSTMPSIMYLRKQGYDPPEKRVYAAGGVITSIGSLAGPIGISLPFPGTSLLASPQAGDRRYRHHAIYIASSVALLIAVCAGIAADIHTILPLELMLTIAGLALTSVLVNALREVATSPLTFGPVFAFAIVLSDLSLLGFSPVFWGVVIGSGISLIFEREGLQPVAQTGRP